MKSPIKGWQPLKNAADKHNISRQWLSRLAKLGDIDSMLVNGNYWLPDPLIYRVDRKRQDRAKDSRK